MAHKKYTVLHHDDTHFLMRHPNGSDFKVAKKNLDPRTTSEIKKMAEGGEVEDPTVGLESPDRAMEEIYSALSTKAPPPEEFVSSLSGRSASDAQRPGLISTMFQNPGLNAEQARKLIAERDTSLPPAPTPTASSAAAKEMPPTPRAPGAAADAPPAAPTAGATPTAEPSSGGDKGLYDFEKQQLRGVDAQAKAQAEQGRQQAQVYDTLARNLQVADNDFKEKHAKYTERSEQLMKEVYDGKIDPNQYWENKGTAGKVSAAIGIALAGIGGGMSGQGGNVALDVINKAIDRDVDSQKANLQNKSSLLSKNMELTHNLESAVALTKSNMMAVATAQIGKIAGENAGPQAMAMRDQLQGQLKEHFKTINYGIAQNDAQQAFMNGLESDVVGGKKVDPATYIRYRVPEKDRSKAAEELDKVEKFNERSENIMQLFDRVAQENTALRTAGGWVNPPPSLAAITVELDALAKDREGRTNETVLKHMRELLPQPGEFTKTQTEKRANMMKLLQAGSTSAFLDTYKVPYKRAPQEGPVTKTMGGVKYQKVPGGWKKVG